MARVKPKAREGLEGEGQAVGVNFIVSGHALEHLHARLRGEGVAREHPGQRR